MMNKRLLTTVVAMMLSLFSCLNLWAETGGVIDQGVIGNDNNITWVLAQDGTLTLNGTGEMPDYSEEDTPWMTYNERITKIVMTGSITKITEKSFNDCLNLTDVTFPTTLKSIGANAFSGCDNLKSITLPSALETIDSRAFYDCEKLTTLEIGEGLQSIGQYAFYSCPLVNISISATTPPTCLKNAFNEDMSDATLRVPSYAVASLYRSNEVWKSIFNNIKTIENRLYAEYDKSVQSLKFYYGDETDVAEGIGILDNLPVNFNSRDVAALLDKYIPKDESVYHDNSRYYIKEIDFDQSFHNYKPTSCSELFGNFRYITKISHLEYLNTEDVESMYAMFALCRELESLDLSSFNTSKVKDFQLMFNECFALKNLDLTSFNTGNATTMESMFYNCLRMESIDVSSFNTSTVTNFNSMFYRVHGDEVNKCNIYVSDKFNVENGTGDAMFQKTEDKKYANYITGYFQKKVGTVGNKPIGAKGEVLTISQLTLTDGNDYVLTEEIPVTATEATYSRKMTSKWGTLCLPYAITNDESSDYRFYGIEDINNEVITLSELTGNISAGTPVMFCKKDNATNYTATIKGRGELVHYGKYINRMIGTFESIKLESHHYFIAKDQFRRVGDDKVKQGAYRAHIIYNPTSTEAAPTLRIAVSGEATAINATELFNGVNDGTAEYYNINGVRIDGLQKGMNIVKIGGKTHKVLIK